MSFNLINYKISPIRSKEIKITYHNSNYDNIIISKSLHSFLQQLKEEIDLFPGDWDHIKKYVNPFEFIHTKVPGCKYAVCKYIPISRSFFKFIEIAHTFQINQYFMNKDISSMHLAEAPGGFIEALHYYAKSSSNIKITKSIGLSLCDNKTNIPSWNYSSLNKLNNIYIQNGNVCDLTKESNYLYCVKNYEKDFHVITADGGFDFSTDFNKQETMSHPLILAEVLYAITFQKKGGIFVLKVFDIFTKLTLEIIYLLSSCYEKIYIYKPNTSRVANSEKYIICKNFIITENVRNDLIEIIPSLIKNCNKISSILTNPLPLHFLNKIEEINAVLGQQQLETISQTMTLITHKTQQDKLTTLMEHNIQKSIAWCKKHNFPFNNDFNLC